MTSIRSEIIMQCPYDLNHRIVASKFEHHLIKCQKSAQFDICPFNAKHHVKRNELRTHISSCQDRFRIAHEKLIAENLLEEEPVVASKDPFNTSENWDDELKNPKVPIIPPLPNPQRSRGDSYMTLRPGERRAVKNKMVEDFKKQLNARDENGIPVYIPDLQKK